MGYSVRAPPLPTPFFLRLVLVVLRLLLGKPTTTLPSHHRAARSDQARGEPITPLCHGGCLPLLLCPRRHIRTLFSHARLGHLSLSHQSANLHPIVSQLKFVSLECTMQVNATLLSESICRSYRETHFLELIRHPGSLASSSVLLSSFSVLASERGKEESFRRRKYRSMMFCDLV